MGGMSALVDEIVKIGEKFQLFELQKIIFKDTWTRFRGANYDNVVRIRSR
jgi:hypothetical protein